MAKKVKRLPKWLFPQAIEDEYVKLLTDYTDEMIKQVNDILLAYLGKKSTSELIDILKALKASFDAQKAFEQEKISSIFQQVNKQNSKQAARVVAARYALKAFPIKKLPVDDIRALFVEGNTNLIKTISSRLFNDIEQITINGLLERKSIPTLKKEIQEKCDNSRYNAERIARDQIGKLNAQLTRLRQEDLGVTKYIWRTVGDERVRSTHKLMDGKVVEWTNPPSITNGHHVGQEIMCRCYAEPILEDIEDDNQI